MITISVIVGSTRQGRFAEKPAQWILRLPRPAARRTAPVRSAVHIPVATLWAHFRGGDVDKGLAELETQAQRMIDDLLWWTMALKTARNARQPS